MVQYSVHAFSVVGRRPAAEMFRPSFDGFLQQKAENLEQRSGGRHTKREN